MTYKLNVGKVVIRPRGQYSEEEKYSILDIVIHDGITYICLSKEEVTGKTPDTSDETIWKAITGKSTGSDEPIDIPALNDHIKNMENPHHVTAEQIDAYLKSEVDEKVNSLKSELTEVDNKLKTTKTDLFNLEKRVFPEFSIVRNKVDGTIIVTSKDPETAKYSLANLVDGDYEEKEDPIVEPGDPEEETPDEPEDGDDDEAEEETPEVETFAEAEEVINEEENNDEKYPEDGNAEGDEEETDPEDPEEETPDEPEVLQNKFWITKYTYENGYYTFVIKSNIPETDIYLVPVETEPENVLTEAVAVIGGTNVSDSSVKNWSQLENKPFDNFDEDSIIIKNQNGRSLATINNEWLSGKMEVENKDLFEHIKDSSIHVTTDDKNNWNSHTEDSSIHVTAKDKENWNNKETVGNVQDKIDDAFAKSKDYTDVEVAKIVDGAPESLNTLNELSKALKENEEAYDGLLQVVGEKAEKTYVDSTFATKRELSDSEVKEKQYTDDEIERVEGEIIDGLATKFNKDDVSGLSTETLNKTDGISSVTTSGNDFNVTIYSGNSYILNMILKSTTLKDPFVTITFNINETIKNINDYTLSFLITDSTKLTLNEFDDLEFEITNANIISKKIKMEASGYYRVTITFRSKTSISKKLIVKVSNFKFEEDKKYYGPLFYIEEFMLNKGNIRAEFNKLQESIARFEYESDNVTYYPTTNLLYKSTSYAFKYLTPNSDFTSSYKIGSNSIDGTMIELKNNKTNTSESDVIATMNLSRMAGYSVSTSDIRNDRVYTFSFYVSTPYGDSWKEGLIGGIRLLDKNNNAILLSDNNSITKTSDTWTTSSQGYPLGLRVSLTFFAVTSFTVYDKNVNIELIKGPKYSELIDEVSNINLHSFMLNDGIKPASFNISASEIIKKANTSDIYTKNDIDDKLITSGTESVNLLKDSTINKIFDKININTNKFSGKKSINYAYHLSDTSDERYLTDFNKYPEFGGFIELSIDGIVGDTIQRSNIFTIDKLDINGIMRPGVYTFSFIIETSKPITIDKLSTYRYINSTNTGIKLGGNQQYMMSVSMKITSDTSKTEIIEVYNEKSIDIDSIVGTKLKIHSFMLSKGSVPADYNNNYNIIKNGTTNIINNDNLVLWTNNPTLSKAPYKTELIASTNHMSDYYDHSYIPSTNFEIKIVDIDKDDSYYKNDYIHLYLRAQNMKEKFLQDKIYTMSFLVKSDKELEILGFNGSLFYTGSMTIINTTEIKKINKQYQRIWITFFINREDSYPNNDPTIQVKIKDTTKDLVGSSIFVKNVMVTEGNIPVKFNNNREDIDTLLKFKEDVYTKTEVDSVLGTVNSNILELQETTESNKDTIEALKLKDETREYLQSLLDD